MAGCWGLSSLGGRQPRPPTGPYFHDEAGAATAARGTQNLTFAHDKDAGSGRKLDRAAASDAGERTPPKGRKRPVTPELGHALRNAYQRTIEEDIPPEMLDLLGKLG